MNTKLKRKQYTFHFYDRYLGKFDLDEYGANLPVTVYAATLEEAKSKIPFEELDELKHITEEPFLLFPEFIKLHRTIKRIKITSKTIGVIMFCLFVIYTLRMFFQTVPLTAIKTVAKELCPYLVYAVICLWLILRKN